MIIIRRYKTRKLYAGGQYITLLDILRYIKLGQEFQVLNHDGKDVTQSYKYKALSLEQE